MVDFILNVFVYFLLVFGLTMMAWNLVLLRRNRQVFDFTMRLSARVFELNMRDIIRGDNDTIRHDRWARLASVKYEDMLHQPFRKLTVEEWFGDNDWTEGEV